MSKITIFSYQSHLYREVFEVLEMKDGCTWKTRRLGFIHKDQEASYPYPKYEVTSISTQYTCSTYCTLEPFLKGANK